jgi:hypothetical protein
MPAGNNSGQNQYYCRMYRGTARVNAAQHAGSRATRRRCLERRHSAALQKASFYLPAMGAVRPVVAPLGRLVFAMPARVVPRLWLTPGGDPEVLVVPVPA